MFLNAFCTLRQLGETTFFLLKIHKYKETIIAYHNFIKWYNYLCISENQIEIVNSLYLMGTCPQIFVDNFNHCKIRGPYKEQITIKVLKSWFPVLLFSFSFPVFFSFAYNVDTICIHCWKSYEFVSCSWEVYSITHYVTEFVRDLQQVYCFLH